MCWESDTQTEREVAGMAAVALFGAVGHFLRYILTTPLPPPIRKLPPPGGGLPPPGGGQGAGIGRPRRTGSGSTGGRGPGTGSGGFRPSSEYLPPLEEPLPPPFPPRKRERAPEPGEPVPRWSPSEAPRPEPIDIPPGPEVIDASGVPGRSKLPAGFPRPPLRDLWRHPPLDTEDYLRWLKRMNRDAGDPR